MRVVSQLSALSANYKSKSINTVLLFFAIITVSHFLMPCSPTMNVLSYVERIKISFLFSFPSVRPTLSRAWSVATWSRNTSCVASVMPRYARRRLRYVDRFKEWKVALWGHQQWRPSSCMRGRHQARRTKTRGLWRDPGKGLHGSASDASVLLVGCLYSKPSDWHSAG